MLVNIQTHEQVTEQQFRLLHPNTSFPEHLAEQNVSPFGHALLNFVSPPSAQAGHKYVSDGVEQRDGKWYAKYKEVAFTTDEVSGIASDVRNQRDALLADCDWTQGKDVPNNISSAWATYRQALRNISEQHGFPLSVQWPTPPSSKE